MAAIEIDFVNTALDIIEGIVGGGLLGFGAYIIASAVAGLSGSFMPVGAVGGMSVIVGAMGFVGIAIHNIRARFASKNPQ